MYRTLLISPTADRRDALKNKIAVNMNKMWDFEIVSAENRRFQTSKALLWCRSAYFKTLFADNDVKHIEVDISSSRIEAVLEYVTNGTVLHEDIEDLLQVSAKVSKTRHIASTLVNLAQWEMSGLTKACEYILVHDIITLKNVFKWCAVASRNNHYNLRDYCIWLMRLNYDAIKDKKEFKELPGGDMGSVEYGAWPGSQYKEMRRKWKERHGKKGKY